MKLPVRSSLLFVTSLVMTGMIILIPLDYQLALRWPADEAGLQLIALTGGMAGGSFIVGSLVSRLGRARIFPIIGGCVGILICVFIWLHLNHGAQLLGAAWLVVGLVVAWLMRRGRPGSVETSA